MRYLLRVAPGRPGAVLRAVCLCGLPLIVLGFATRLVFRVSAAPLPGTGIGPVLTLPEVARSDRSVITSTTGAYDNEPCLVITPTGSSATSAEARLFVPSFSGSPISASLVITSCGVAAGERHSIYVNGQRVAGVKENSGPTCSCGSGRSDSYAITPSLVISGWNVISITNDANLRKGWTAYAPKLVVEGELRAATISEFWTNEQPTDPQRWASYQLPIDYDPTQSHPLLVVVGATFGDEIHGLRKQYRQEALLRSVAQRASERGWLVLAPSVRECEAREVGSIRDMRGGGRTASKKTQHDFIRAIEYMKAHFNVDASRIYISGFSSGGGVAAEMGVKYPDVFAAVVDWAGPNDLLEYSKGSGELLLTMEHYDFGCYVSGDPEDPCGPEWKSRSAREATQNLWHVPMAVIHGRADTEVPVGQSEDFYHSMARDYVPEENNKFFFYHDGGCVDTLPGFDELEWMSGFQLNACPKDLNIRSDENKSYYWIAFHQKDWNGNTGVIYSKVEASYDPATRVISATIGDERGFMGGNLPLDVDFLLDRLAACFPGLDPAAGYTIEDYNIYTGDYVIHRNVVPEAGRLTVSLDRDKLRMVKHHFLIYPFSAPELITATLQQGVSPTLGYAGVADTYVNNEDRTTNYATASDFLLTYNGSRVALLRFDLDSIPANAEVKSAHLALYLTQDKTTSMDISVYRMLQPWAADQATWLQASQGQPWAVAGVLGENVDYASPALSSTTVELRGFYTFNLQPVMQTWLAGGNLGMLIAGPRREGSGSVWYRFASSDASAASQRPKLVVEYMLPAVMPTPTDIATVTATPSASPTATPSSTDTPTASATPGSSETPTQTPTATPTATEMPTATPTAPSTETPTATTTRQSTPTATATPVGASCVRWDNAWHDEFEDPTLAQWQTDWGQGAGVMQDSALCLKADGSNSDHFPVLWTQVAFPQRDYVLEVRFRYDLLARYGAFISVGSAVYDGVRYDEGALPADVADVLSIEQSSTQFRVSLFGLVDWFGPVPDTRWHVVQVAQEGSIYHMSVDGQRIGAVSRTDKVPAGLLMGNPAVMYYPGPWTSLYVDYVRVATCALLGDRHVWLPLLLRSTPAGAGTFRQ